MKTRTKNKLETAKQKLCDKALSEIVPEIQKTCARFGWTFKTVYGITILNKKGDEIFETNLHQLVFWYEDTFGPFPFWVCEKGEWIEGETPLIQFEKPRLTA